MEKSTPRPPFSINSLRRVRKVSRTSGSRPPVGSSMIRSSALWERASASASFILVPEDRVLILREGSRPKRFDSFRNSSSCQLL